MCERASRSRSTFGQIVKDALRLSVQRSPATEAPPLPTYGGSGVLPGVDLTSSAALREQMDRDTPFDALR